MIIPDNDFLIFGLFLPFFLLTDEGLGGGGSSSIWELIVTIIITIVTTVTTTELGAQSGNYSGAKAVVGYQERNLDKIGPIAATYDPELSTWFGGEFQ